MYQLITLGSLHVKGQAWRPAKALTLVAYLSLEGPTPRRRLRELFWPDARDPGASLRVVLDNFRRHLPGIVTGNETLETAASSDAASLLGLESAGTESGSFYAGAFLADTDLSGVSDELQEWIVATRERLAIAARLAALRTAELAGSPAKAGEWAERAASVTGAPPLELGEMERLLRLSLPGSRLESELRQELAEYSGPPTLARADSAEPELLGRERELELLLLALSEGHNRLVEITGAGGVGKSTLATALLREQADLSGVPLLSIPLETVQSSSEAAARMVVALQLQVTDRGDGWLALAQAWGERPLLVLLDGAEGLPELGRGVETLLAHCPGVRVVVTSRVQRLTGAVHLVLDGLSVPAAGEPPEHVARSAAVQLFVRGARRYLPRFALDSQSAPLVAAIVRRLGGHPLATVLSATWMRVYPPAQIHTLILQDLTALRAESGGSERHQLSAVFERSWQLLTSDEARAIAALAVFQGFTPEAALEVAGVDADLLDRLSHHSLLQEQPSGSRGQRRLEVPPVLAAQAQAHLADAGSVLDAHAACYLNHLMTHAPESGEVDDERYNIVAALGHAVSQGRDVSAHIDALLATYDRRGLLDSGTDAFYGLQNVCSTGDEDSDTNGSVLIGLAWLAHRSTRHADAEKIVSAILDERRTFGLETKMKANNIMALSLMYKKETDAPLYFYQQALRLAYILGDRSRQVMYSLNVSIVRTRKGEYAEALNVIEQVAKSNENALSPEMMMLIETQVIENWYVSSVSDAEMMLKVFTDYLRKYADQRRSRPYMVTRSLYTAQLLDCGQLGAAEQAIRETVEVLKMTQTADVALANRIAEVRLLYLQGRSAQARRMALQALASVQELKDEDGLCELILACAADLLGQDMSLGRNALSLVTEVLSHTDFQARRAAKLLPDVEQAPAMNRDTETILSQVRAALDSGSTPA